MREWQKVLLVVFVVIGLVAAVVAYPYVNAYVHLDEAYAAWDAGILVVCFLERNDKKWPTSWDELTASVQPNDKCVYFVGVDDPNDRKNGYPKRLAQIRRYVNIDWNYRPESGKTGTPFTRTNGGKLFILWGDPNAAVYRYITDGYKENYEIL